MGSSATAYLAFGFDLGYDPELPGHDSYYEAIEALEAAHEGVKVINYGGRHNDALFVALKDTVQRANEGATAVHFHKDIFVIAVLHDVAKVLGVEPTISWHIFGEYS